MAINPFLISNRLHPCPICGDTQGNCRFLRSNPNFVLCMGKGDGGNPPEGTIELGETRNFLWRMFLLPSPDSPQLPAALPTKEATTTTTAEDHFNEDHFNILREIKIRLRKIDEEKRAERAQRIQESLQGWQHEWLRPRHSKYLIKTFAIDKQLAGFALGDADLNRWEKVFGFKPRVIPFGETVPVPVELNDLSRFFFSWQWGEKLEGLAILIKDAHNRVVGLQLKHGSDIEASQIYDPFTINSLDSPSPRYQWITHYFGCDNHYEDTGELPVGVFRPTEDPELPNGELWLCEGFKKAAIACLKHRRTFLGFGSIAQLSSSCAEIIHQIQLLKPKKVIFCPDAKSWDNETVARQIIRFLTILPQLLPEDIQVFVADWGQAVKVGINPLLLILPVTPYPIQDVDELAAGKLEQALLEPVGTYLNKLKRYSYTKFLGIEDVLPVANALANQCNPSQVFQLNVEDLAALNQSFAQEIIDKFTFWDVVVSSPLATGKSKFTHNLLKAYLQRLEQRQERANVLVITHRLPLAMHLTHQLSELTGKEFLLVGQNKNENVPYSLEKSEKNSYYLVSCAQGLLSADADLPVKNVPDILILDEFSKSLETILISEICRKKRDLLIKRLFYLLINAKIVLLADGDLSPLELQFFRYCRAFRVSDTPTLFLLNSPSPAKKEATVVNYPNEDAIIALAVKALQQNKKVLFLSSQKRIVEKFELLAKSLCPGVKGLAISSETNHDLLIQDFFHDPNGHLDLHPEYRFVACSPSFAEGFSIEKPFFDCVFAAFPSGTLTPQNACQFLHRYRPLSDLSADNLFIWLKNHSRNPKKIYAKKAALSKYWQKLFSDLPEHIKNTLFSYPEALERLIKQFMQWTDSYFLKKERNQDSFYEATLECLTANGFSFFFLSSDRDFDKFSYSCNTLPPLVVSLQQESKSFREKISKIYQQLPFYRFTKSVREETPRAASELEQTLAFLGLNPRHWKQFLKVYISADTSERLPGTVLEDFHIAIDLLEQEPDLVLLEAPVKNPLVSFLVKFLKNRKRLIESVLNLELLMKSFSISENSSFQLNLDKAAELDLKEISDSLSSTNQFKFILPNDLPKRRQQLKFLKEVGFFDLLELLAKGSFIAAHEGIVHGQPTYTHLLDRLYDNLKNRSSELKYLFAITIGKTKKIQLISKLLNYFGFSLKPKFAYLENSKKKIRIYFLEINPIVKTALQLRSAKFLAPNSDNSDDPDTPDNDLNYSDSNLGYNNNSTNNPNEANNIPDNTDNTHTNNLPEEDDAHAIHHLLTRFTRCLLQLNKSKFANTSIFTSLKFFFYQLRKFLKILLHLHPNPPPITFFSTA